MGAIANHRKREQCSDSTDFRISKKPRLSFIPERPPDRNVGLPNSTVSRISGYPNTTRKLCREVHAPCRILKFGYQLLRPKSSNHQEKGIPIVDEMGRFLSRKLDSAKRKAFSVCRYIVDRDGAQESVQIESKLGDSSVKEVEATKEDGQAGRSAAREVKLCDEVADMEHNSDVEILERPEAPACASIGLKNTDRMLNLLSLNGESVLSDVKAYKMLLENVERKSGRLRQLQFEIEFNEKKRSSLSLFRSKKRLEVQPLKEIPSECFTPLTSDEEVEVNWALATRNRMRRLVSHVNSNIEITGKILQCLLPGAWLNDEVINVYLELLKEREKREPHKFLKCHFFNTFFYKKLTSGEQHIYDYKSVRRWTTEKKLGYCLFHCDKIFIPVHKEIHWCLAIINKKDRKLQYLDSLKGRDFDVLDNLAHYYVEEVKEKNKELIDVSNWDREFLEDLPEQHNGFDCGMFMVKYADFYSRGIGLCFGQKHMPYFRMRTAKEIIKLRAD